MTFTSNWPTPRAVYRDPQPLAPCAGCGMPVMQSETRIRIGRVVWHAACWRKEQSS